jgi:hypothetical protein
MGSDGVMIVFKKYRMLLLLSSAWSMGTGFRFIMMQPHDLYIFSWFDKFFDWGVLFFLGILLFILTIYTFLKEEKNE